jgi:hypothetical protein
VRYLRLAAWSTFGLDLVVLAQLLYGMLTQHGGPAADPAVRGLAVILGSALLAIAVLLSVSSWLRSRSGLWISLGCAAVPLSWAINAIVESLWE